MTAPGAIRDRIRSLTFADESEALAALVAEAAPQPDARARAAVRGAALVRSMREDSRPGLMEVFLAEYGLSTREGIALMCLAEALLRVPDAETMDALIEDKIAPSEWGAHLGKSSSPLVNASTWALMLTGRVLREDEGAGMAHVLHGAVKRLGEPVIRAAVGRAMREMGQQFVLGETIAAATRRAARMEARGYTYSYDMLGEAALTRADADAFFEAYANAIAALAPLCTSGDIRENPGISIKLSALHPRYETPQAHRLDELIARVRTLTQAAKAANMGLNIDAEEAERLDLSLDVIEAVLSDEALAGWDGFGVVVQAYGLRAPAVIDWLYALAGTLDRRIMVRLVKGAYWDREIKRAQVEGLSGFPVYTRKQATDAAYLCCAGKLLGMIGRIYPQFATHNAHTVAAILEMAGDNRRAFEFQRLHGMGEALHDTVLAAEGTRCRIYAPVGAHRDLLAYLVRRLLENGANSSFVNQVLDPEVAPEEIAADPFDGLGEAGPNPAVLPPARLFGARTNSRGFDLFEPADMARVEALRSPFLSDHQWQARPTGGTHGARPVAITNPAEPSEVVGHVTEADAALTDATLAAARKWHAAASERAETLRHAATLYEARAGEIFALLAREAGKTLPDAVAELREAVDFLRYYADQAETLVNPARGVFACISPWNFPLAIFTGQIAAALAAGNGVIAKPAEATPLIAALGVELLHEAGVPLDVLQLLPGPGAGVGAQLCGDARIAGVCFTGSTATAQRINRVMAASLAPSAPLIAETGGLNAMVVDSTALPEQAIRDIIQSAFRSAGQRCSALRMLYLQQDIAGPFLDMLYGAMDELIAGDPRQARVDVGPVISQAARADILHYVEAARTEGRVLKQVPVPAQGLFVPPTVIDLPGGIASLEREVFGPVLHVATYPADALAEVIEAVNARGFGLTFGMHSRIDDRVQDVTARLKVGNIYVNRNQIGAIVGSQPFGGEGLSGTGPKAGGPHYVPRFALAPAAALPAETGAPLSTRAIQAALDALPRPRPGPLSVTDLPGPTGESNRLSLFARGRVLCLGPTAPAAREQARIATARGCSALAIAPGIGEEGLDGTCPPEALSALEGIDAVLFRGPEAEARALRRALAARDGALVPLIADTDPGPRLIIERHLCVDTTAAGGNATLLAAAG